MTKILVSEFAGKSSILGPQLDWGENLSERSLLLVNLLRDPNHIPFEILQVVYWILIAVAVLVILTITIFILKGKGISALDAIKNLFRGG